MSHVGVEYPCGCHRQEKIDLPYAPTISAPCKVCSFEGRDGGVKIHLEGKKVRTSLMCRNHGKQSVTLSKPVDDTLLIVRCPECFEEGRVRSPGIVFITFPEKVARAPYFVFPRDPVPADKIDPLLEEVKNEIEYFRSIIRRSGGDSVLPGNLIEKLTKMKSDLKRFREEALREEILREEADIQDLNEFLDSIPPRRIVLDGSEDTLS